MAVEIAKVLQRSRCRVFLQADTLLLNLQQPIEQPSAAAAQAKQDGMLNGASARVAAATN